jgi:type II secretory pathway component PulF
MSELNLLPSQAKFQAQRMHIKALVATFLWIFGGFWVIFLVVVLGIFLIFQVILNQLTKNYQKNESQYANLLGSIVINQKVNYQAKIVAKVLSDRFEYGKSMEIVKNMFSNGVVVDSMDIVDIKLFSVTGHLVDGQEMNAVEDKISQINNGEIDQFVSAKLTDVKVSIDNSWTFKVEVKLK